MGVLVFLFIAGSLGQYYIPRAEEYFMNKRGEKMIADWEAKKKALEELEKQDFVGGKTPEETMEMVIEALEKNDVELASRYYSVEVRELALKSLESEFSKNNNLSLSTKYFSDVFYKGIGKFNKDKTKKSFNFSYITSSTSTTTVGVDTVVVPAGSVSTKFLDLKLNINNIWKIVQPY